MPKPPLDPNSLGGRLEILCRERRLFAADVARATGIAASSISDWMRQKTTPAADAIVKLADFFAVSCDYLLCRTNVRCTMPDAGQHLANAGELARALRGDAPPGSPACYMVAEDIRLVTAEELHELDRIIAGKKPRKR